MKNSDQRQWRVGWLLVVVIVGSGFAVIARSSWFKANRRVQKQLKKGKRRSDLAALWQGDVETARALLAQPADEYSFFRRACLEAHERDAKQARHWLTQCDLSDPATRVLGRMLESDDEDVDWLECFVRAWNSSGRPDLRKSRSLGPDCSFSYEHAGDFAGLTETERALAAFLCHRAGDDYPSWLRQWAENVDSDCDVAIALVAIEILRSPLGELPTSCDHLIQHAASSSSDMTLALRGFLYGRVQGGFKEDELAPFEAIANAPTVSASLGGAVRDRLMPVAQKANLTSPSLSANGGAIACLALPPIQHLFGALDATEDERQERAALIALKIGSRLLEDRFLITFALGTAIIKFANKTLRDPSLTAQTEERETELSSLQNLPADPSAWPLPNLVLEAQEARWENELSYLRRFDQARVPVATLVR